jgi:RNA-directed DNA polymerase
MLDGTYTFTSYRETLISKGANSPPRVVSVATSRDRVVLKALTDVVHDVFPNSKTPMAQIKVARVIAAMRNPRHNTYVRVDIRNFYPSISHQALAKQLNRRIRKPEVTSLILRAIRTPTVPMASSRPNFSAARGVPQGLSLSNSLAEISMSNIDEKFGKDPDIAYFRYVDDILVLCDAEIASRIFGEVGASCRDAGLDPHPLSPGSKSKIGPVSEGFDFLGYQIDSRKVSVRSSSVRRFESSIVEQFTKYKHEMRSKKTEAEAQQARLALERRLNLMITGCVFENIPRGWIHYFSQLDDLVLIKRIDAFISRLTIRFKLPADFQLKSLMRSYWLIKHPDKQSQSYIPNFDRYSLQDKRDLLQSLFPKLSFHDLPHAELNRRFNVELRKIVSKLERDIRKFS